MVKWYLFLLAALLFNSLANVLIKLGAGDLAFKERGLVKGVLNNYILWTGLAFFGLNFIFYALSLTKINLSVAYPIMAGGALLVITLFSVLYFKEQLSASQIIGVGLLFLGIILVSQKV